MAKTQDIRRRIRSIQNTRQLTKAMKMVSAAKLKRATAAVVAARPYAEHMHAMLVSIAGRAGADTHPLLEARPERRVEVVVLTGDKGLCGSFNGNIVKAALRFVESMRDAEVRAHVVGKRGRDSLRRLRIPMERERVDVSRRMDAGLAREIAADVLERFLDGRIDAAYLVYNRFRSAISHTVSIERLLPIERPEAAADVPSEDYIYEPDAATLFDRLLPRSVEIQLHRAILESVAAEHGARMTAMDSATRNAGELIDGLTLHMNRVRQAAITTEIIEVVSGAAALE